MNESQILSVFQEPASEPPVAVPAQALVFDACHVGVVLRAVLFVETAVGVGAMFGAATFFDW
ncbi:MAG: sensor histidine kinase, partial [Rhodoferax sp.]|nr:sensor histidine kinase [Rhodoferax sp.]